MGSVAVNKGKDSIVGVNKGEDSIVGGRKTATELAAAEKCMATQPLAFSLDGQAEGRSKGRCRIPADNPSILPSILPSIHPSVYLDPRKTLPNLTCARWRSAPTNDRPPEPGNKSDPEPLISTAQTNLRLMASTHHDKDFRLLGRTQCTPSTRYVDRSTHAHTPSSTQGSQNGERINEKKSGVLQIPLRARKKCGERGRKRQRQRSCGAKRKGKKNSKCEKGGLLGICGSLFLRHGLDCCIIVPAVLVHVLFGLGEAFPTKRFVSLGLLRSLCLSLRKFGESVCTYVRLCPCRGL